MTDAVPLALPDVSVLAPFLTLNPETKCEIVDGDLVIRRPWDDESLTLRVKPADEALIDALNKLRLPPRFAAIRHSDSGDMEFIFAAISRDDDLRGRRFNYTFCGRELVCEYGDASERLRLVARATEFPARASSTDNRHLGPVRSWVRFHDKDPDAEVFTKAALTSFFIRGVVVPEDELVPLARHLNFYMGYFDRSSPTIDIHAEPDTAARLTRSLRYPLGRFPEAIAGRELDPYLLGLWEGAWSVGDSVREYLYAYQILEYAAFYFLRDDILRAIRRIAGAPDLPSRVDDVAHQILDVIVDDKLGDEQKMENVIQQVVDPELVWREVEHRKEYFSAPCEFDGGLSVPPLIREGWGLDDFKAAWLPKVPDALRKIRNALVHARERRQAKCIAPTDANQRLLRPWTAVITAVANEIVLYGAA